MDNLPQKICESCIQIVESMQAFQEKCKRNNEELQERIRNRNDSKNDIEILDDIDTKQYFEVVSVDEKDSKEILDIEDTKEIFEVLHIDKSGTKGILKVVDVHESDTKEIFEANDDDPGFAIELDEESASNEILTKPSRKVVKRKNTNKFPKSRLDGTFACYICGKRYHNYKLEYHINTHKG